MLQLGRDEGCHPFQRRLDRAYWTLLGRGALFNTPKISPHPGLKLLLHSLRMPCCSSVVEIQPRVSSTTTPTRTGNPTAKGEIMKPFLAAPSLSFIFLLVDTDVANAHGVIAKSFLPCPKRWFSIFHEVVWSAPRKEMCLSMYDTGHNIVPTTYHIE